MYVIKRDGERELLNINKIHKAASWACEGLDVSLSDLEASAHIQFYEGMSTDSIQDSLIKSAADKISQSHQDWSFVAARLLLQKIYKYANNGKIDYPHLRVYIQEMVERDRVDDGLLTYDMDLLNEAIDKSRDLKFSYLGLQTLHDRYLLRSKEGMIRELPQHFLMRVAMGVALEEKTLSLRNEWAIRYYNMFSMHKALASTPTLFNAGTNFPQLSSCFVLSMEDSLEGIMGSLTEAAQYSKFSGGIGMDITRVRSMGSFIGSTNGKAGGIIPYAKIYNDILLGFDQGGKRKGAGSLYLEPWHADIEEFLDLKNTSGDDRRRAHDIFPALWLNDIFMERVRDGQDWSLFSPSTVPQLTETYGAEFNKIYTKAEKDGLATKVIPAKNLFRKMLTKLFENGTYWPCFKDRANERYPQKQSGMVRSSNLCTEILLRTSDEVSAVCNLGSINLAALNEEDNFAGLEDTVCTMVRFLDSVISVGLVPHAKGLKFNQSDRAIGLGVMGYTELLVKMGIDFESQEHMDFANKLFERISYAAIQASADLAQEKGSYPTFHESDWAKGIVPVDTMQPHVLRKLNMENPCTLDWTAMRQTVQQGMRNSCLLAIAPTATIANILNVSQSIELPYKKVYAKENMSGSFEVIAPALQYGKDYLCKNAFEVDQIWSIKAAAIRQIWIDQGQSLNVYVYEDTPGKELQRIYMNAWEYGLKTTYYLRSQAPELQQSSKVKVCSIMEPDCESCQ